MPTIATKDRVTRVVLVVAIGACLPNATAQDLMTKAASVTQQSREEWVLPRQEDAIAGAERYLGLTKAKPNERMFAQLVILEDDDTPYLRDQVVGRPLWHIVVKDVDLCSRLAPLPAEKSKLCQPGEQMTTFDVVVDPVDGRLLKILTRWPDHVPHVLRMPPAADAERQLAGSRGEGERYHAFPAETPAVSFFEALRTVVVDGVGNVFAAKQIVGSYVVWSKGGEDPEPVWAITCFWCSAEGELGVMPHLRNIVKATTPEWVVAANSPHTEACSQERRKKLHHPMP